MALNSNRSSAEKGRRSDINLDVWTETYGVGYYLGYLMQWGDLFS
jgi:hypothetical protein